MDAKLLNFGSESAHWYSKDGKPMHKVPYADPSKGMKNTTLRDARKLNLAPSVSGITGMMPKQGLDKWKTEQAVMAALTLKRGRGESDEEFLKRLAIDAKAITTRAADHGTAIHANIERYLKGKSIKDNIDGYPVRNATLRFAEYWEAEGFGLISAESTFCHSLGYGGTVDIRAWKQGEHGKEFILDVKTKDTVEGKEIKPYKEYGMQLAAYRRGVDAPEGTRLINLFISRNDPEFEVQPYEWEEEAPLLDLFDACLTFWKAVKGYDSSF